MTDQDQIDACLKEIADLRQVRDWQENVIKDMGARLEIDLRTLAALTGLRERWGKKADQLRAQPLWCSSSDLRQAATLDACSYALSEAVAREVPAGGVS